MFKCLVTLTIFFFGSATFAQQAELITITGVILDAQTKEQLPYVHISIKGHNLGVPTNEEGAFALTIPATLIRDSLHISHIGYRSKTVAIQSLPKGQYHSFLLHENTMELDALTIEAQLVDVEGIIKNVASKLKDHFPISAFDFEGFYRNSYSESGTYVRQFETAFSGFEGNFHARSGHSVKMLKKKESTDYRKHKWRQAQGNIPWHYMWHIRRQHHHFFTGKQYQKYHYTLEDITSFEDEQVYKLKFVPKDQSNEVRESWAFIRASDFAILEIGGNWQIVNPKKIKLSDSLSLAYTGGETLVKYVEYQGKMYPRYSRSFYKHNAFGIQGHARGRFDMNEELIIHDITNPSGYNNKKDFEQHMSAKLLALPADSLFWKNYQRPVETELSKAIQRDLERHRLGTTIEE